MTTTITFNYEGTQTTLSCTNDEKMEDICNKLASMVKAKVNEICFLYGATPINKKLTFNQLVKSYDRDNNMVNFLGIKKSLMMKIIMIIILLIQLKELER